jgi:hypothetical protein
MSAKENGHISPKGRNAAEAARNRSGRSDEYREARNEELLIGIERQIPDEEPERELAPVPELEITDCDSSRRTPPRTAHGGRRSYAVIEERLEQLEADMETRLDEHDEQLRQIFETLRQLIGPGYQIVNDPGRSWSRMARSLVTRPKPCSIAVA